MRYTTERLKQRVRDIVRELHEEGVYPSCRNVAERLGRRWLNLTPPECGVRYLEMKKLGIPQKPPRHRDVRGRYVSNRSRV